MNRSFFNVILGGLEQIEQTLRRSKKRTKTSKSGNADDAAFLMKNASSVIIVPGYGMAVAQAQHALREMVDTLKKNDIRSFIRNSSCGWTNAWSYECFISRSKCSLR